MASDDSGEVLRLRTDRMTWREVDGEVIVLDLRSASYFAVNESAASLWRALAAGTTRGQMIRLLVDEYDLDEQRADADVDKFIASCQANELLDP